MGDSRGLGDRAASVGVVESLDPVSVVEARRRFGGGASHASGRRQGDFRYRLLALLAGIATSFVARGGWAGATFVESTEASGLMATHAPSFALESGVTILAYFCPGGVAGDFDRDGDQDIFFPAGGQVEDSLFINDGNGVFTDEAAAWGVAVKHMGLSACVGDYDNDGWLDIYVTSGGLEGAIPAAGKHRLYRNTGRGSFENVAAQAGVHKASPITCDGMGCTFGDYDLDGDLDLYVSGWLYQSKGNRLFRNNGNGTFTDVTVAAGIPLLGIRGYAPRFVDMDGDRHPELLIAGDFGTSRYYRNNADGTFTDLTVASGTGLDDNGMGQTVADFNGDGLLDWFVTSIYSSKGNPEVPGTGNMLYLATGPHQFVEASTEAGVKNGKWGWGTSAVDIDHDGRLDLVQTNGWPVYPEFNNQPTRVWLNMGVGGDDRGIGTPTFAEIAAQCGLWHTLQGRGLLHADFDLDGDQDVVIFDYKGPIRYYRNVLSEGAGWLRISLERGNASRIAPNGFGSRVVVTTPSVDPARTMLRHLDGGSNHLSQSELTVHVGLGSARMADVRVQWADGTATLLRDVAADQHLTIVASERSDLDGDGTVGSADLGRLLAMWGAIDPVDPTDLNADGFIDELDVAILLGHWSP